jgi:hypothetical protein
MHLLRNSWPACWTQSDDRHGPVKRIGVYGDASQMLVLHRACGPRRGNDSVQGGSGVGTKHNRAMVPVPPDWRETRRKSCGPWPSEAERCKSANPPPQRHSTPDPTGCGRSCGRRARGRPCACAIAAPCGDREIRRDRSSTIGRLLALSYGPVHIPGSSARRGRPRARAAVCVLRPPRPGFEPRSAQLHRP